MIIIFVFDAVAMFITTVINDIKQHKANYIKVDVKLT